MFMTQINILHISCLCVMLVVFQNEYYWNMFILGNNHDHGDRHTGKRDC